MTDKHQDLSRLHAALGYRRLSRTWAKLEIVFGLTAAGIGLLLGQWLFARPTAEVSWGLVAAALLLFVLGGYLALAGSRSHLYQTGNELAAYVVGEMSRLQHKG
jgi:hypothetical protein